MRIKIDVDLKALVTRKNLIRLIIAGLGLLVLVILSAEMTSRPSFCPTCHYMKPYYESWKNSAHKDISCGNCHFPPGLTGTIRAKFEGLIQVVNYVSQTYTRRKPWAEISDVSCIKCHEERLLKGKVDFKEAIVFDHASHLGEMRRNKKLRCTSCHSQIVQGDHMTVTPSTCFLCHFKKGDDIDAETYKKMSDCKLCHHWERIPEKDMGKFKFNHTTVVKRDIACGRCHPNVVVGDGFVPKENCYNCHFDNERLNKFDDHGELHRNHIAEHKIECTQCHMPIQHKVQKFASDQEPDCVSCHTDMHNQEVSLLLGKPFNGISGKPNPMFAAGMNCPSCHIFHGKLTGNADVKIAEPESCETCHGKGYAHLLSLWKEVADRKIADLKRTVVNVDAALKKSPAAGSGELRALMDKAQEGVRLVDVGKAIHNIAYANEIISTCYEYLRTVITRAKLEVALPIQSSSEAIPKACNQCHFGIESIEREIYGMTFVHQKHISRKNISCGTCHSHKKVHGEMILGREQCMNCHHQAGPELETNCKTCHSQVAEIFSGSYLGKALPDIMNQAGIECAACHIADGKVVRPDVTVCATCHDAGYRDMAVLWRQEVAALLVKARDHITKLKAAGKNTAELENNLAVLEKYGAGGLHNYQLLTAVLGEINADNR